MRRTAHINWQVIIRCWQISQPHYFINNAFRCFLGNCFKTLSPNINRQLALRCKSRRTQGVVSAKPWSSRSLRPLASITRPSGKSGKRSPVATVMPSFRPIQSILPTGSPSGPLTVESPALSAWDWQPLARLTVRRIFPIPPRTKASEPQCGA